LESKLKSRIEIVKIKEPSTQENAETGREVLETTPIYLLDGLSLKNSGVIFFKVRTSKTMTYYDRNCLINVTCEQLNKHIVSY
jgi:restriction endonuclease S subunit